MASDMFAGKSLLCTTQHALLSLPYLFKPCLQRSKVLQHINLRLCIVFSCEPTNVQGRNTNTQLHQLLQIHHCTNHYKYTITPTTTNTPLHQLLQIHHYTDYYKYTITPTTTNTSLLYVLILFCTNHYKYTITPTTTNTSLHRLLQIHHYTNYYKYIIIPTTTNTPLHQLLPIHHYTNYYKYTITPTGHWR